MDLLIDPHLLTSAGIDQAPGALIALHKVVRTSFDRCDPDLLTGPRCPRCDTLLVEHVWQLVDRDRVVDCERAP